MGPTLLLDKSALHSFARMETLWLHRYYNINLAPVLFMEVMADLHKHASDLQLSLEEVRRLADKLSGIGSYENEHAGTLVLIELCGAVFEMDGRPVLAQPDHVINVNGERGLVYNESPERQAMRMWIDGKIDDFQMALAKRWREAIRTIDFEKIVRETKDFRKNLKDSDLPQILSLATTFADAEGQRYRGLKFMLQTLEISSPYQPRIIKRWIAMGRPPLRQFAPYAWYCLRVQIFFMLGLVAGKIPPRRSNRIDMQYLLYLPFCKIFCSRDKLHVDVVPLFLRDDQMFVHADDLRSDLAAIRVYREETRAANNDEDEAYPPRLPNSLTCSIWDRYVPNWREMAREPKHISTPEENAKTMARLRPAMEAIEKLSKRSRDLRQYSRLKP